jgi:translation initiation factor RLI1
VLRRMIFIREDQEYPEIKVGQALRAASWCYPNWDSGLASSLVDDFGLRTDRAVKKLSRGQRSALGITICLAARAEITLFDEPYAGLDAVARQVFYDRLLALTAQTLTDLARLIADLIGPRAVVASPGPRPAPALRPPAPATGGRSSAPCWPDCSPARATTARRGGPDPGRATPGSST